MLSTFCAPVVCSAHLMKGVKYFVKSSMRYHRNKEHKQPVLDVSVHLFVCHDFNIKNCLWSISRVFYPVY